MTERDTRAAVAAIRARAAHSPSIGVILGSGLGRLAEEVRDAVRIPYPDIPGFEKSTAPGHAGELVVGRLEGKDVAVMNGRFHYYEGYEPQAVTFPVRVLRALGAKTLLVSNPAGACIPCGARATSCSSPTTSISSATIR